MKWRFTKMEYGEYEYTSPCETVSFSIRRDEHAESPREWDNSTKLILFHRKYNLGDTDHGFDCNDYDGWDEMEKAIREECDVQAIKPVYMHEHGGVTINTTGFSCGWDSGQIGFVILDGNERCDWEMLDQEQKDKVLVHEVEVYDAYLKGEVYTVEIIKRSSLFMHGVRYWSDWVSQDSCGGFYGEDHNENGVCDFLMEWEDEMKVIFGEEDVQS